MGNQPAGINYTTLHNELVTDPSGIGYAAFLTANDFNGLMALLNVPSAKFPVVTHAPIAANDFMAAIKASELVTLTTSQLAQIQLYVTANNVNIGDPDVQAWVNLIWPSAIAPNTNLALTSLATRLQSPLEFLFGVGTFISNVDDVIRAYKSGQ